MVRRKLYLSLGVVSLVIGFAGVFLPLVPTTPLVLLSAFLFSKSSPRLHRWLLSHKTFGPTIQDWETAQIIRPRAKVTSLVLMFALVGYTALFVTSSSYLRIFLVAITAGVACFIITRPSNEKQRSQ